MPDAPPEHRRLAAIMFTDMVDYSALAQRDETLALKLLEEHRQILRSLFSRFNGAEIKTIGDAFLVEFHSALEAAECGIEIQRTLAKRNHDVAADRRIEVRIGIHIGDVVHRGGDVYGDGVNIASRIQAVAGAGGICVSMDVERQIHNKLEARLRKISPDRIEKYSRADGAVSDRAAVGERCSIDASSARCCRSGAAETLPHLGCRRFLSARLNWRSHLVATVKDHSSDALR